MGRESTIEWPSSHYWGLNAHFDPENGDRCWGRTTRNGFLALGMCDRLSMTCVDTNNALCHGPTFTFCNSRGGKSYVDHCMMSNNLVNNVVSCSVWFQCVENISDHTPVSVVQQMSDIPDTLTIPPEHGHLAWDKISYDAIKARYTHIIESESTKHG